VPAGIAARVAGWQQRLRHLPGPLPAGLSPSGGTGLEVAPFPLSPLDVHVELFVFGNWVEITEFVYVRDRIVITRGRADEANQVDPTRIRLTLNTRDGRFSPRNPTGLLYGQIGRNTQLRVRIGNDIRGVAEVPAWPARWDLAAADVWVPIEAAGILRRLQQGATPLRSTQYRFITLGAAALFSNVATAPVAYWPCEDGGGSETIASGIGGPPMAVIGGPPTFASNTDFAGSEPLPVITSSTWTGAVPGYTSTGTIHARFLMSIPAAGETNGAVICRIICAGTAPRWDMVYATGGQFTVNAYDAAGSLILTSGPTALDPVNGSPVQMKFELQQSGPDVVWTVGTQTLDDVGTSTIMGTTLAGNTVGRALRILVDPNQNLTDTAIGHVVVWSASAASDLTRANPITGYVSETAGNRILRLCAEEGIAYVRVPPSHTSTPMGAQLPGTLAGLLRECETADQGILFEPRTFLGLAFLDRKALYNRAPALALDYTGEQITSLEPVDDDQATRNDITVSRTGGSSYRAVQDTGPLSTQDPPAGAGRYDDAVTVNTQTDASLPDQAGWRRHLGTVDEARYPTVTLNLATPGFVADTALCADAAALDIGQRLTVSNPPPWLPPEEISQAAQGFTETIGPFERAIDVNCSPERPWQVAVYDDPDTRYSPDGSELAASYGTSDTSLLVATPSGPLWSTTAADFDIAISGERMTVTSITGGTSPQTFAVTRSVNGVVKALTAGDQVTLARPAVYAL
jgi:hypothetical protein